MLTSDAANSTSAPASHNSTHYSQSLRLNQTNPPFSTQSLSTATVSCINIQTLAYPDGSRGTFSVDPTSPSPSIHVISDGQNTPKSKRQARIESDDRFSDASYNLTLRSNRELASLLEERLQCHSHARTFLSIQSDNINIFESQTISNTALQNFENEFDEVDPINSEEGNEEAVILQWKAKCKHYLILSAAGKPIYSRHGDQNLINGYIGIIQTIISFYQDSNDSLMGFSAEGTRFVISTYGPLYLVAISRLEESDFQINLQLEALYMQILSTLTLPTLTQLFTNRPNTDLRRPLQGTENLLSSLADTFTKGSPSALLSSLECLMLPKSQRHVINNSLLKARNDKLLYGLIVAGSRLVSVVRPKRHSLHPSDLQLIFNMLFEAEGIRTGGGENWIPLCLPAFNNRGYLYVYVSFLSTSEEQASQSSSGIMTRDLNKDIAIVLISADKESFFDLKQIRDETVIDLENNGSLEIINKAIHKGRLSVSDIVPETQLRHFLYKSRTNVQFMMPEFPSDLDGLVAQRRLMTLYHKLHASIHSKNSQIKVIQCTSRDTTSLAWSTPVFELYCIAGPNLSRIAMTQWANKIIRWIRCEEEKLFIIGGAIF